MRKLGFDNKKYLETQSEQIEKRIGEYGGKLYLEFGGKLYDDYHASRVLPGFAPDSKMQMLQKLADKVEIVIAVNATDIESNRVRGDLGIFYDNEALRMVDIFKSLGLYVGSVVITMYEPRASVEAFKNKLEMLGMRVFRHYYISEYPFNIGKIVSAEGYGRNNYIETSHPLVVVTAPGPGSGKMAVCMSQLYHEHARGKKAGYAKFETFPIWNLPLKHPVNLAYEAATVDLQDVNMIDPYHLEAYGKVAVNYNRDVETFPVLNAIFQKIGDGTPYRSPTDMGVNMAGYCITDNEVVVKAARDEIVRRYYAAACARRKGIWPESAVRKAELVMEQALVSTRDREVVFEALDKEAITGMPAMAIQLSDGRIVRGKTSDLLGPSASALLNAAKALAGIPKRQLIIAPSVIEPIQSLKVGTLGNRNPRLHSDETLIALAISAATDPSARAAMDALCELKGCEAHSTVIVPQVDEEAYRRLGINLTCEPRYETNAFFHK